MRVMEFAAPVAHSAVAQAINAEFRVYVWEPALTRWQFYIVQGMRPAGTKSSSWGKGEPRMYDTGDRCRYLPSGSIEVIGRCDFMVKVSQVKPSEGRMKCRSSYRIRATIYFCVCSLLTVPCCCALCYSLSAVVVVP